MVAVAVGFLLFLNIDDDDDADDEDVCDEDDRIDTGPDASRLWCLLYNDGVEQTNQGQAPVPLKNTWFGQKGGGGMGFPFSPY